MAVVYVPCQCRCGDLFMLNPEAKINLVKGEFTFILGEKGTLHSLVWGKCPG